MKADKVYIVATNFLINLLARNGRLFCVAFVLNLTYLVQIVLMSDVLEGYRGDKIILLPITVCFVLQVFVTAAVLSVLPKIFTWVFVGLSAIFFATDVVTLTLFRSLFDKSMFQILLDTNIQEAEEFISGHTALVVGKIFFASVAAIVLVLCLNAAGKIFGRLLNRRTRLVRFAVIFSLMISSLMAAEIFSSRVLFPKDGISVVRMAIAIPEAVNEIREYQEIYRNIDAAQIELTRNQNDLPFVVFILGESTSRGHLGIYGYHNPTTPNLQRRAERGELIVFTDCVSGADATMPACQRLFTFFGNGGG